MRFAFIIIALLIVMLASCGQDETAPGGSGLIEATEIIVSSETAGQLLNMYKSSGDKIVSGDTICLIDTTAIALQINQLDALLKSVETQYEIAVITEEQAAQNFDLADKEFTRVTSLLKSGSTNQQRYDQAENGYKQAQLAVKQAGAALDAARAGIENTKAQFAIARNQYNNCFPAAPMSGMIVDDYADAGELLGPGSPIVKIARLDTVTVKVYLPPADLTKIKIGGIAYIDPEDGSESKIEGSISWISSSAEFSPKNVQTKEARADLLYAVKVKIPNHDERLKIGMPVSIILEEY